MTSSHILGGSRETYKTQQLETAVNVFPLFCRAGVWEPLPRRLPLILPWGQASRARSAMAALTLAGGAGSWPGGLGSPRGTSAGAATSCRQGGQPARSGRCRGGQGRNGDDLYDRAGKSRPPVPPRLLGSAVVRGVDTLGAGLGAGSPIPRGPAPTGLSPFISSLFAKPAPVFLTFSSGLLPAVRNMKSISPKSAQNTVQTNVFLAASLIQKSSLWPLVRPERCPARPGVRGPSPRPPRPSNA